MRKVTVSFFLFMCVHLSVSVHAQMDTLKISGTKYLCDIIQTMLPDFYSTQPNCVVKFVSMDNTPHALSDFMLQGVDIALTTQTLSEKDKQKITFSYKEQEFAKDAIVFYVSNKNNVKGLTLPQIHEIYTEKTHEWSTITGKNEKIMLVAYPLGHDFTIQLYKTAWNGEYYSMSAMVAETSEQFQSKLNINSYTIGYTAHSMKIKGNIVPILVNNVSVSANEENILNGKYPLAYSCYSIVNTKKTSANKFLEWLVLPTTKKKLKSSNLYPTSL
jgi:phosphate transport system substrate-binding protein